MIDDFYNRANSFDSDSKEWKYMNKMYLSAQVLGSGKATRKREYTELIDSATAERDRKLERAGKKTFIGKLLESYAPVGSFVGTYLISKGLLDYFVPDMSEELKNGISVGNGFFVAESVESIENLIRRKRIRKVTDKFDRSIEKSRDSYKTEVAKEYEFALRKCRRAWEESFGEAPPNGEADISWLLAA